MDFHKMKRKELQALCKKHKIPANMTNFEMANRLTFLFKGKDRFFTERRSCLKLLDENGCEIESNVENKHVKKVRFSPEIQMFQFEKSEPQVFEVKKRGKRTSVTNEVSIVENVGGPELSDEVVTSSRGRRLVEKIVADNEESRVMTRRSSRLREILEGGKRKEDMEKGRKGNGRERNLRQGKQRAKNAKRGESNVESVAILAEKKLRRSKRNVMKVEDYKLMSSGTVAIGSSLEPLNTMVSEGIGPSGLDIDAGMGGEEKSRVGLAMRRLRRTASRNEPLITLDDLVAEVNYERKLKRQKKALVQEQEEVVLVDSISIEMPLTPLSPNAKRSEKVAPAIVAGKSSRKAKRKSKKQTVEIEDSLHENLATEELHGVDVQPSRAGATEDSIATDSDNGENYASESAELDDIQPRTGTSHSQTNEVDQSGRTDPKGIQIWVDLPIDMETMTRLASLDHLVEDEGISGEHQGSETVSVDVLERYRNASLNGPCEREGCKSCEVNLADSDGANPNYNGDCSSTLSSGRALEHEDLSLNMQTNDVEIDNVTGDRNFDREELKCVVSAKSYEHNPLEENYEASDKFYESSFPEPSRSATKMLESGNVKGREDSEEPRIECGTCLSSVESTTKGNTADSKAEKEEGAGLIELCKRTDGFPARKDHNDENPVNSEDVIAATKCRTNLSPHGTAEHHYGESIDSMNLNTTLEQRDQSPTMHWNGCEASCAAEINRDCDQLKLKSDELSKFAEVRPLEEQYHSPKKCSRCSTSDAFIRSAKSMLQEEIDKSEGSVGLQENASGPKKQSDEAEPDKDANVYLIQSYVREDCTSIKRDKNHEENPLKSDIAMVALKCGTGNSPCVPVLHNNEETTITMKLDIALEQRELSLDVDSGCEAESVAEVDRNNGQVELKSDALSKPANDRPLEERYHSPNKCWESSTSGTSISARSIPQDEIDNYEDSVGVLKNAASPEKSYEAEPDKDENVGFNQSCVREECTDDKRDDDHLANPTSFDNAKCGTYNLPSVSVLHYNDEATNTMKLDISLEERVHSPVVNRNGCEADSVAEVDRNHDQVDLKPKDLSRSIEERPFDENYCFPRSIQQGSKDSIEWQANTTSSRKSLEDTPDKVGNMGFTDSRVIKKCISVQINDNVKEVSVYSEDLMGSIGSFSHIPLVDNNEYTGSRNSAMALDHSEQTPILQTEDDRSLDQLELYSDESAQSNVSYSRSGGRMLQDEVVSGNKDSIKWQEINYEVAPEEDGNADYIKSYVIDRYTSIKNYEDKSEDAMGEMSETVNFAHITMVDKNEHICTRNLEMMALENKEQSLSMQQNGCETDFVADDYQNQEHRELKYDKSVKDRPFKEQCSFPDKCWMPSASYLFRRIDAGEDFKKSADLLGTSTVTPSLAAEAVERNSSATENSSSISNFGSTDPLDPTPTLDGPEFNEVSDDANKSRQSTCPDTTVQKQENMDAINGVADAVKTCKEANDYVDLASFKGENNNAEDVDVTKFQEVALAVESSISYAIEAADTSAEGAHSPSSGNNAQRQGDEAFAINSGKKDSNGSSEKISHFASTELSEAKFDMNNFKEEFSCKDQEDSGKENRENLAASFPQVEFIIAEIQCEEKIVDIREDVSLKLYKHHEILKESDVADTINEYIESESTMNPSLRIVDTSETLDIGMSTKVPELEDKHAEQTVYTGELSVEKDDQVKGSEAAKNLEETVLGSAWISDSKTANNQCKNTDLVAEKSICLGTPKNMRAILIHGTPKKLQMLADMKENLPSFKGEKVGFLTTVKPTTKRTALMDVLQKK